MVKGGGGRLGNMMFSYLTLLTVKVHIVEARPSKYHFKSDLRSDQDHLLKNDLRSYNFYLRVHAVYRLQVYILLCCCWWCWGDL
jgi:hypothetical protein